VLFVNGIPIAVVERKKGSSNCANPMQEAFEQLQRYMNQRKATHQQGLKEGEPRLFHTNLLLIRTCSLEADFGTITSSQEHFFPWKTQWPQDDATAAALKPQQQLINTQPAEHSANLHRLHGYRQRPPHQSGLSLSAI
jgi:type I restriction enzyme, R subunit